MARLIEVGTELPQRLTVRVGDVLNFAASGGAVETGAEVIEAIGPFAPAIVGLEGRTVHAESPPTSVLFRAQAPGRARLAVFTGFGSRTPGRATIEILVED